MESRPYEFPITSIRNPKLVHTRFRVGTFRPPEGNMASPQVAAAKHESEGIMSWNILKMK